MVILLLSLIFIIFFDFNEDISLQFMFFVVLSTLLLDWLASKRLGALNKLSYPDGNSTALKWTDAVIGGIAVVLLFIYVKCSFDHNVIKWFLVASFVVKFGLQSVLEWKYLKGTKHVVSIVLMAFSVTAVLTVFFIVDQHRYVTMEELFLSKVNMEKIDRIEVNRYSDNTLVTFRDQSTIKSLLSDLSGLELKEQSSSYIAKEIYTVRYYYPEGLAYMIAFDENDQLYFADRIGSSKNSTNTYVILNGGNQLRTLNDEDINWQSD